MIIPLDKNCFWCIVPYSDHVEICRQNVAVSFEECNWSKMTTEEKESVCNRLIDDARKEYSDVPDVSKRPICFEVLIMPQTTIRPKDPVTETVADILILGNYVKITFFEKDSDFKDVIKSHGFRWGGEGWERKCNKFTGSTLDRATEIAIKLLKAGFIISIVDDELKDKILKKEYEPEQKRWIAQRVDGKYQNWFAVSYEYGNEKLYKAARAIAGSRWSNPSVVIPPYQYEAILDLVDQYGFKLSDGAQELIESAKKAREEALIVDMSEAELPTEEPQKKECDGIHASLRDDD